MKSLKRKNFTGDCPGDFQFFLLFPFLPTSSIWSAARLRYTKLYATRSIYRNSKMADDALEELHESLLQFVSLSFMSLSKSLNGWLNDLFL